MPKKNLPQNVSIHVSTLVEKLIKVYRESLLAGDQLNLKTPKVVLGPGLELTNSEIWKFAGKTIKRRVKNVFIVYIFPDAGKIYTLVHKILKKYQ